MSTKNIAEAVTVDGNTKNVQVESGHYLVAVAGTFDGASVALHANIGAAKAVPVDGATYASSKANVVWLPSCTIYLAVLGAGASTEINAAISKIITEMEVK